MMPDRTHSDGDESDRLVDATKGGDIDGLPPDGSLRSNASRVLARSGVDDSVNEDLDGVLVGEEVDDLKGVGDDADGHLLLLREGEGRVSRGAGRVGTGGLTPELRPFIIRLCVE